MSVVSDFFQFQNGYAFKSKEFEADGAYKIIRIKELKDGVVRFFDDTATITPSDDFDIEKYLVKKGDVLFALTGDPVNKPNPLSWVGRVSVYNHDEPALLNQRVCKVVPTTNIDPRYLYYFFRQDQEFYELAAKATGSASQANISTKTIEQHTISMPKRESTEKVIITMGKFDEGIDVYEKMVAAIEAQINALYVAMFETFELIEDEKVETELGVIPKTWEIQELQSVTENIRDRVGEENYRVLSAINTGELIPSDEHFSKQVYSKDISKYICVRENDIAYNPARVNIGSIGINDLGYVGCVSPVYVVVRPEKGYHNYMKYFVRSNRFHEEVLTRASGSVRQSMNYCDFGLIKVAYPPRDIVEKFNGYVNPLLDAVHYLNKKANGLKEIRETLLPKLIADACVSE